MENKTPEQIMLERDIMRYKTNKLPRMLALLSLVFNCLYFMLFYSVNDTHFYDYEIGFSVILTLVVLLVVFLSSEGIKNYSKTYCYVVLVIAAFQILRIFGYPLDGLKNDMFVSTASTGGYFGYYPTSSGVYFAIFVIYLVASAACLIASGVFGLIQASRLEAYLKKVQNGEVDIIALIKKLDNEDAVAESVKVDSDSAKEVK